MESGESTPLSRRPFSGRGANQQTSFPVFAGTTVADKEPQHMLKALDISTSGLVAQRIRLNAISANLANMSSVRNEKGEATPYQAKFVVFQPDEQVQTKHGAVGVKVSSVRTETMEPRYVYQPGHPLAIKHGKWKGYVAHPNIDMVSEFVDALVASRAYEANLGVMEVSKNLGEQSLRIIA
jgi:flagellar basal-body rod protein FlgC